MNCVLLTSCLVFDLQTLDGSQIRVREDQEDADLQRGRSSNEGRARSSRDSFASGRGVKVCHVLELQCKFSLAACSCTYMITDDIDGKQSKHAACQTSNFAVGVICFLLALPSIVSSCEGVCAGVSS